MDMNRGYVGWSMSKRAKAAYADGEQPISRWTKKAIISAIADWEDDNNRAMTVDYHTMTRDQLIDRWIRLSSYHHTSKMINRTDFYHLDEELLVKDSRQLTKEEITAKREDTRREREKEREEEEKRNQELEELHRRREEEEEDWLKNHDYAIDSWWRYAVDHPDVVISSRISKKGNTIYHIVITSDSVDKEMTEDQMKKSYCPFVIR